MITDWQNTDLAHIVGGKKDIIQNNSSVHPHLIIDRLIEKEKEKNKLDNTGIDPVTYRMQSDRSTI